MNPQIQQYGILYGQRLFQLKFNAKQIVSIVNLQIASAKLTGIMHGPLYRRFTFRQVSFVASFLIFSGTMLTAFCTSFLQFLICFSIIYGIGMGLNISATMLAVNTYFKKHRRRAMGLTVTITGLGPIIFPHLIVFLLSVYGSQGAICIIAALTFNCLVCSCALQPVVWHVDQRKTIAQKNLLELKKVDFHEAAKNDTSNTIETEEFAELSSQSDNIKTESIKQTNKSDISDNIELDDDHSKKSCNRTHKVIKFFDLDLLKDLTFLNLIQGLTIMMFGELNFSFLTPFILSNYSYENEQISLAMSLLAFMDVFVRFSAPFLLEKFEISNCALFGFGIVIITIGRLLITFSYSYISILMIFLLIGFGKAFRTVFAALVIPSYVPLKRLPAASGLQSFLDALFSVFCGPMLGMIVDATNYNVAIHVVNGASCFSLLLWFMEWLVRRMLEKPVNHMNEI